MENSCRVLYILCRMPNRALNLMIVSERSGGTLVDKFVSIPLHFFFAQPYPIKIICGLTISLTSRLRVKEVPGRP